MAKISHTKPKVPIRDAVAAYRAVLLRDKGKHDAISSTLTNARLNIAFRMYPYTKGPDLTNDGLGYGERIRELNRVGPTLERQPRMSIVTRSGRSVEASSSPSPATTTSGTGQPGSRGLDRPAGSDKPLAGRKATKQVEVTKKTGVNKQVKKVSTAKKSAKKAAVKKT